MTILAQPTPWRLQEVSMPSPRAGLRGPALMILMLSISLLSYWGDAETNTQLGLVSQGIVGVIGAIILCAALFTGKGLVFPKELLTLTAFYLFCLATLQNGASEFLVTDGLMTGVKLLGMAFVIINAINGRGAYKWFLVSMVVGVVLASLGGLTGLARGSEVVESAGGRLQRYQGTFGNPNGLAQLACYAVWGLVGAFLAARFKTGRILLGAGLAYCVIVIGWAGSKQGIIGLGLIVVVTYIFVVRKTARTWTRKFIFFAAIMVAFVGGVAYLSTTPFWGRMAEMVNVVEGTGMPSGGGESDRYRLQYYQLCLRVMADNPLIGVGLNCTRIYNMNHSTHNTFFEIGSSTGIIGWTLFFGVFPIMIFRMRKINRLPITLPDRNLLLSGWALFSFIAIQAFTTELQKDKLFISTIAGFVGYMCWLQRTYAGAGRLR